MTFNNLNSPNIDKFNKLNSPTSNKQNILNELCLDNIIYKEN